MRLTPLFLVFSELACAQIPKVPASLQAPADERLTFQAHGVGVQVYACDRKDGHFAWVLQGPDAKLIDRDGKTIGKHFAGPSWQANDGSSIAAKPAATVPSPDSSSVPWLLLKVTKKEGAGVLSGVLNVQRLNTKGGKAPAEGCEASHQGQTIRIPYEADYYFYSASVL